MSEQIKNYEISLWEDYYDEDLQKYEERKILVIGSDKMKTSNRAFSPIFTEKNNGERTFEFSILHKVYSEYTSIKQENQFIPYLVNERKVKLKYGDEWFDFVIKSRTESSENTFTYNCEDANVLDLSKKGYNLELSTELKNNQGTAIELGEKVLENTDWIIDVDDCDDIKTYLDEPAYLGSLSRTIRAVDMEDPNLTEIFLENDTRVYVFYNLIKDKQPKDMQLVLYKDKSEYIFDDNNVCLEKNYRVVSSYEYDENGFPDFFTPDSSILFKDFQFKRLVRKQKSLYDRITEKVVDEYETTKTDDEIYHYIDTVYTTSDILTNYITNGDNFTLSVETEITGWDKGTLSQAIKLETIPTLEQIKSNTEIYKDVRNYLKITSKAGNYFFNTGIKDSAYLIKNFVKGEKYSFKIRGGILNGNKVENSERIKNLKPVIAGYKIENNTYVINEDQIIFDFRNVTPTPDNIIISNGVFDSNHENYFINEVPQAPDLMAYYTESGSNTIWKWSGSENKYVEAHFESGKEMNFYRMDAECLIPFSDIQNRKENIGIFFYDRNNDLNSITYYIEAVQLFKYIEDGNGVPMSIGSIPEGKIINNDFFYLKPNDKTKKEDITFYNDLESIANFLGLREEDIIPKFDERCLAVSMIEIKNSNYFDALQKICERFECWLKINIEREEIYLKTEDKEISYKKDYYVYDSELEEYIKVDFPIEEDLQNYYEKITTGAPRIDETTGRPIKKVAFKKYIGKDNYAGFKYGVNLSKIERTFSSDEIVTKLIVPISVNEYADTGFCTIRRAKSNVSKLSYILNFNYYITQGLFKDNIEILEDFYINIGEINQEILEKQKELDSIDTKLSKIDSQRIVFDNYIEKAIAELNESIREFEFITKKTFSQQSLSDIDLKYDSLVEITTRIFLCQSILNNYSGIVQSLNNEYSKIREKGYGFPTYNLTIQEITDDNNNVFYRWFLDDYVKGLNFILKNNTGDSITIDTTDFSKGGSFNFKPTHIYLENIIKDYKVLDGENVIPIKTDYPIGDISSNTFSAKIKPISNETLNENSLEGQIERKRKEAEAIEKDFLEKVGDFIQEGTWNSNDYFDDELYYLDAVKASFQNGKPKVEYSIDVIEISGVEGFSGYEFKIGDKTYIEDTEFFGYININSVPTPVKEEIIISEITHHLDSPEEDSITVKNYKTEFEDLFQRLAATTQTIQYKEGSYARAASAIDLSGIINPQVLLNSIEGLGGQSYGLTNNGIIRITNDGILVIDIKDFNRQIRLTSCAIQTTTDSGVTWTNVLTPDGLNTQYLRAGSIDTNQITLLDRNRPSFRWDSSGLNAYSFENGDYNLGKFVRFDQYGLYGIDGEEFFKPISINEIEENAKFGLTWDGFFLNSDHGAVKISSDNDIQVFNGNDKVKIHIGRIVTEPEEKYGIRINDNDGNLVLETDDDGDLALAGLLSSISYKENPSTGWAVNGEGNAIFNNITARGAIKTAVFEYAEIQAVGGVFLFRPSSRIKTARIGNPEKGEDLNDIIVTVDKPELFKTGAWCKVSNYYTGEEPPESITKNNGLLYIYPISVAKVPDPENPEKEITEITLTGAAKMMEGEKPPIESEVELIGGALVDMGNINKNSNYGIGINSSDNSVALPPRSISLFETTINSDSDVKVTYDYKGVLGTLPSLGNKVNSLYETNMIGTQGLYTDNLYLGNKDQYIMFYEYKEDEETKKTLRIKSEHFTLENSSSDTDNYLFLSDEIYEEIKGTGKEISIAGSDSRGDWRQIIGKNFGVTEKGELYANGASIAGTIYVGERNTQPLNSIVEIGGGGISLGNPKGFHIFIGGKEEDKFTYGLGFYNGSHKPSYIETVDSEVDENKKYYELIEGEYIEVTNPSGNPRKNGWYERKDSRVAYINSNKLSIPYTVVLRGMEVGKWIWELQEDTNNLTLKWQGGID